MTKRKALEVQKEIYETIKANNGITMSALERKIRTNPNSLVEHCKQLQYFGLIEIKKEIKTRRLFVS